MRLSRGPPGAFSPTLDAPVLRVKEALGLGFVLVRNVLRADRSSLRARTIRAEFLNGGVKADAVGDRSGRSGTSYGSARFTNRLMDDISGGLDLTNDADALPCRQHAVLGITM